MRAYHRTEANETDSIAICGTREEWAVIAAVLDGVLDFAQIADDVVDLLQAEGVTY